MNRSGCNHVEDTWRCCMASVLELHPRDVQTPGELASSLAGRGLAVVQLALPNATDLRFFRGLGYWLLTGPRGTTIMLGESVAWAPLQGEALSLDAAGPWQASFLVPLNPMFVRPHKRPA